MTTTPQEQIDRLQKENERLKGLLAWGNDPCIYCQLPKAEIVKCVSGFPGCSRADDMMISWEIGEKMYPDLNNDIFD